MPGPIIILDSDPENRTRFLMPLLAWGYRIHEASNAAEATQLLTAHSDIRCLIYGATCTAQDVEQVDSFITGDMRVRIAVLMELDRELTDRRNGTSHELCDDFFFRPASLVELRLRLKHAARSLVERNRQNCLQNILANQTTIDSTTGLLTHSSFLERLEIELNRSQKNQLSLSLLKIRMVIHSQRENFLLDSTVDQSMFNFGRCILHSVRNYDVCGRVGNRDVLVLFPETNLPDLEAITRRVKQAAQTAMSDAGLAYATKFFLGGVTLYPQLISSGSEILSIADNALAAATMQPDGVYLLDRIETSLESALASAEFEGKPGGSQTPVSL